jgi:menin
VADVENLRIEPPVELHIVEALYSKFQAVIRGYCDVSLLQEADSRTATRALIKRVSDIVWNTLTKSQYKDRAHLQSIYSYLTGSKLDCFGVAMAVVAGCQVLGFSDVHLSLSEDHAWVVFGQQGDQTAEVTWHSKGNEDKRGLPVDREKARDSWLYVGGRPVQCTRHMEVATLVSSINPAMTPAMDCLEVGVLQQELLWLLYDLGHLDRYPMALGGPHPPYP